MTTPGVFRSIRERDLVALDELLRDEQARQRLLQRRSRGRGPLHVAAENAWADGVARLLDAGADVDEPDSEQQTALHHAVPTPRWKTTPVAHRSMPSSKTSTPSTSATPPAC